MKTKRIVANIAASQETMDRAASFYRDVFRLDAWMDHGWIATFGSSERMQVQLSIATEGGSGTSVPDLSIEVDDVDEAFARVQATAWLTSSGVCAGLMYAIRSAN